MSCLKVEFNCFILVTMASHTWEIGTQGGAAEQRLMFSYICQLCASLEYLNNARKSPHLGTHICTAAVAAPQGSLLSALQAQDPNRWVCRPACGTSRT